MAPHKITPWRLNLIASLHRVDLCRFVKEVCEASARNVNFETLVWNLHARTMVDAIPHHLESTSAFVRVGMRDRTVKK
ncbi:hypothetical protein ACTXT7_000903 [Hymenolepis weldensis]